MPRRHLNLTTKLAAALLQLRDDDGPLIEWEHAKQMSDTQIVSLFAFDHYPIRHEAGGPDEPWNLVPRLIIPHRVKTATIDVPEIAKIKRVTKDQEAFRARLLAKGGGDAQPKSRWGSRPMRRK